MSVGTSISGNAFGFGVLVTAFVFGFRHGIDWDHLAAITDITGTQERARRSIGLATLYALGHAAVVFGLGVAAIAFSEQLPSSVDAVMERVVGATLIALAVYVVVSLVRHGRDFRMRSRWMLVIAGVRRLARGVSDSRSRSSGVVAVEHEHAHGHAGLHAHAHAHPEALRATGTVAVRSRVRTHTHRHRHAGTMPDDPFASYSVASAVGIGALHGIGAETPTQVVLFVAAAGATGAGAGILLLTCFIVGLLASNTLVAAAATLGFLRSSRRFPVYATVSAITAAFSLVVGVLFVLGRGDVLPAIFGG